MRSGKEDTTGLGGSWLTLSWLQYRIETTKAFILVFSVESTTRHLVVPPHLVLRCSSRSDMQRMFPCVEIQPMGAIER
jgi:hypothetical protein